MGDWVALYLIIAEGDTKDIDSFERYFHSGEAVLADLKKKPHSGEGFRISYKENGYEPYAGMRSTCQRINNNKIYVTIEDDDSTGGGWQTHSFIEPLAEKFPELNFVNIFVIDVSDSEAYIYSEMGFEAFAGGKPVKSLTIPIGAIDWDFSYSMNILYEELYRKMLFAIDYPREKLTPAKKKFLNYLDSITDKNGEFRHGDALKFHSLISRKDFYKLESNYYETILNRLINTPVFDYLFAEAKKEESGLPNSIYRHYSLKWLTKRFIVDKKLDKYFTIAKDFIKRNKNLLIKDYFDYSSTWYLLPLQEDDEKYFGHLSMGKNLQDKAAFRKQKNDPVKSRIRIASLDDLCSELSEPFVYPVKIEESTRVEKAGKYGWYVEKAILLEPFNVWEIFSNPDNHFRGSINLNGQPSLPLGLVFPSTVKGDLKFNHNILPPEIKLPDHIYGELSFQFCKIPPAWKLPARVGKLQLLSSSFHKSLSFAKTKASIISITGCDHSPKVEFPKDFEGQIQLEDETLSKSFVLPETIRDLSLSSIAFEKGAALPKKILGGLVLHEIQEFNDVKMPASCTKFSAMSCAFPETFLESIQDLKEIQFIMCELPDKFVIPDIPLEKLSFVEMNVPKGIRLPSRFNGTLEFNFATVPGGITLPQDFSGKLRIICSGIKGSIKLPLSKTYDIIVTKGDNLKKFKAPAWLKKKITFEPPDMPYCPPDDDLPF